MVLSSMNRARTPWLRSPPILLAITKPIPVTNLPMPLHVKEPILTNSASMGGAFGPGHLYTIESDGGAKRQIAIDHFPSWYNNHIRIKKLDVKKEQVDSKCPLPKRGNSTPTDGIPSKKARTESDIRNESQDDNTDESIYYDPPASPTATTKGTLGNDALVINNPLSTLFSTPRPPLASPPAANNHQSSTISASAEPEPALLAAIAESHPIAPPVRQSTLTIPSIATADFISSTNDIDKVQEDTRPGPVVAPSHALDDGPTSPNPSSQQVPTPASRSRKARRATVGKVDNPKNRCKSAWLEKHPDGNEEQFKAYWNTVKGT